MPKPAADRLRSFLPLAVGGLLFVLGLYALHHLLAPVNLEDVWARIRNMPPTILMASVLGVAVSYAALIFYDWFALRFVGRRLPAGPVALGGFLGFAFGNTIGVSVVSGGAVRYRIYSALGLSFFEVATLSAYLAVAVGTGLTLIGLAALALHPGAAGSVLSYTPEAIRWVAGGLFLVGMAVIIWASARRSSLRFRGLDLRMPPLPDLFGQLAATLIDVAAAAFALWILLPEGRPDFTAFIAIYAAATMIGVISHVPGGIGVFETVVIGALPPTVPVGEVAAALLMFRLTYYLLPFAIGFLLVALNEARAAGGAAARIVGRLSDPVQTGLTTLHELVPSLVAAVAFGFGSFLLLVTMIPAMRTDAIADGDLTAALLLEGGTLAAAVAGLALLILSHGLIRRVSSAYHLSVIMLIVAAGSALLNHLDLADATILLSGAVALLPFHRAFDRHGPLTEGSFGPRWFALVAAVLLAAGTLFFFAHRAVPYSNDLWIAFSAESDAPRSLRAGLLLSILLFLFCLFLLTRPVRRIAPAEVTPDTLARAARLAAEARSPQAWLSQVGDKRFLFSDAGDAFIMYGVHRGSWVALGDPVGNEAAFEPLCWAFCELADGANCRPVFYEVTERHLPLWVGMGFALNKVGEEAVIHLADFSLSGSKFKTMRAAQNKRERDGYEAAILQPPHSDALIAQLHGISEAWLGSKAGAEKKFSVGRFDAAYLAHFEIAVTRRSGRMVAFASIMSSAGGKAVAVDLMRYLPDEASGLMEYMFLRLIEHYRGTGADEFSLGVCPLAGLSDKTVGRSWNKYGRLIFRHGGAFYNFEGLRAFKQKFQPEWRPRYIALPPHQSPLMAMGDVALLIAGSRRGLFGR
ncbi:bifunctional lysylphosphatidylglycerol flippase/synthetase MprF [uncultured Paracoccus sp.]|uniref:bifunctional lysylphosphatidylglycerol flippase/synthetase MprF n=1 Tax=uncultured Paracoccus sp. TaxID=189685 RepID=UPI00262089B0|nr:bifunctional lysylphosphatidylglycerol flippase/synthetase MprF [uncultured Paracoccus sp.]